ncbi:SDR family NAD(P)-dependent oxidoreductase [Novosphingobium sp.]|uniref:SDR family NAD(P)-dependent oxidoreductase n=1 Tax=Novosphingobium sp. TaxID=1874826 RepID=UPI003BAD3B5E
MIVVMTGATSGIGLKAAERLLSLPDMQLIVGARDPDRAPAILRRKAQLITLDLADLGSVASFAHEARKLGKINVLALNAGVQNVKDTRTADGFEATFAVNHLAHFHLVQALQGDLRPSGRVVITASGTHDPAEKTGMPGPRHADAQLLAYPETDPDRDAKPVTAGRRAYTASKLCNVLMARELARRLAVSDPGIAVIAFDPAFTPGTGLARNYPGPVGAIFRHVLPWTTRPSESASTPARSGEYLANLILSGAYAKARGDYYAVKGTTLRHQPPSLLAQDPAVAGALWNDSERLIASARSFNQAGAA